jgi:hypothetical protein
MPRAPQRRRFTRRIDPYNRKAVREIGVAGPQGISGHAHRLLRDELTSVHIIGLPATTEEKDIENWCLKTVLAGDSEQDPSVDVRSVIQRISLSWPVKRKTPGPIPLDDPTSLLHRWAHVQFTSTKFCQDMRDKARPEVFGENASPIVRYQRLSAHNNTSD